MSHQRFAYDIPFDHDEGRSEGWSESTLRLGRLKEGAALSLASTTLLRLDLTVLTVFAVFGNRPDGP